MEELHELTERKDDARPAGETYKSGSDETVLDTAAAATASRDKGQIRHQFVGEA